MSESSEKLVLENEEISRYSRQLILPGLEVEGQKKLKGSSAIIIGAGGLGCPAAIYLAGAGLGRICIVDHDVLDTSNLHRQVQHKERSIGSSKAASLREQLLALNSMIQVDAIEKLITSENALEIIQPYDVIVDASDNMATRYLLNDTAVLLNKPLVSGSALRWEGQLTLYHYGDSGPCYRCIYPTPPPPSAVTNCNDGGVVGAVVGVIGSLQALETILVILRRPNYSQKIFLFDGSTGQTRLMDLRPKKPDCPACGQDSELKKHGLLDYKAFCGAGPNDAPVPLALLSSDQRMTSVEYFRSVERQPHLLLDVRPAIQFKITHLAQAKNVPLASIDQAVADSLGDKDQQIVCMCRRGIASQKAVLKLKELGFTNVRDIIGGYTTMSQEDPSLPKY